MAVTAPVALRRAGEEPAVLLPGVTKFQASPAAPSTVAGVPLKLPAVPAVWPPLMSTCTRCITWAEAGGGLGSAATFQTLVPSNTASKGPGKGLLVLCGAPKKSVSSCQGVPSGCSKGVPGTAALPSKAEATRARVRAVPQAGSAFN